MDKQQTINALQGSWITDDGMLSFDIVGERIVNMTSTTNVGTSDTNLHISWFEPFKKWQISVIRFFWMTAYITELTTDSFTVMNFQKGADEKLLVHPKTLELLNPDFVFKFIRRQDGF